MDGCTIYRTITITVPLPPPPVPPMPPFDQIFTIIFGLYVIIIGVLTCALVGDASRWCDIAADCRCGAKTYHTHRSASGKSRPQGRTRSHKVSQGLDHGHGLCHGPQPTAWPRPRPRHGHGHGSATAACMYIYIYIYVDTWDRDTSLFAER